jgi:hypothetical protein
MADVELAVALDKHKEDQRVRLDEAMSKIKSKLSCCTQTVVSLMAYHQTGLLICSCGKSYTRTQSGSISETKPTYEKRPKHIPDAIETYLLKR